MTTKHITSAAALALAMASGLAHAQATPPASPPFTRFEFAAATKQYTALDTAPGRQNLYFVGEGAGKFHVEGGLIYVWIQCGAVDTLIAGRKPVYHGVGDCELKSASGGLSYGRFVTPVGKGDRGRLSFSGGTGDLARFNGTVAPVMARVNPYLTGKATFYFESVADSVIGQDDPNFRLQ